MNQSSDPKRDELRDRLMDQALRELLAGETPPDLSDRIFAAVEKPTPVSLQRKDERMGKFSWRNRWVLSGVAACLIAGVTVGLLISSRYRAREVAQRAGEASQALTLPHYMEDDVEYSPAPPSWDLAKAAAGLKSARSGSATPSSGSPPYVIAKPVYETSPSAQSQPAQAGRQYQAGQRLNVLADQSVELQYGSGPSTGYAAPSAGASASIAGNSAYGTAKPVYEAEQSDQQSASPSAGVARYGYAKEVFKSPQPNQDQSGQPGIVPVQTAERPSELIPPLELMLSKKLDIPAGQGPGMGGDRYDRVVETGFVTVKDQPLSTFSIDVDTASYANVRRFLLESGQLPPPDAVRIEELVNYFDYDYAGPEGEVPFAAHIAVAGCPWQPEHRLVRIGLKGKEIPEEERPQSNLVFLLDVSGSMSTPDKLPLLKEGMKLLAEQVRENDRVAIVVYAGSEGLVLPSTPGAQRKEILAAIDRLEAGGSTNGGAGIELAYRIAQENFLPKGTNRVVLCTDGDFNVGTTSTGDLTRIVEEKARSGVFLSVLGFGRGNLNDAMMEKIADKGNGNYAYVDNIGEARKVLVQQMGGTLITIAKDVKIQVEFNPGRVAAYRLIGYENRALAAQDFNDDRKDAGEIGAGHTVTALYELVPVGVEVDASTVDPLKYQPVAEPKKDPSASEELLTLKLRYKAPDADTSQKLEFPLVDQGKSFNQADADFQFAASVASFGMLLRDSQYKGTATYGAVLEIATSAKGSDLHGYRAEFLEMVRRAQGLSGR